MSEDGRAIVLRDGRFEVYATEGPGDAPNYEVFDTKVGGYFPVQWDTAEEALAGAREWAARSEARGETLQVINDF